MDNTPEWGYCLIKGCREAALPLWLSGSATGDPDLLYCHAHLGAAMWRDRMDNLRLKAALKGFLDEPYGCTFCDSGKLRNPAKEHDADCPYFVAHALLANAPSPPPYALVPVEDERAARLCDEAAARLRRECAAPASEAVEAVARAAIDQEASDAPR